MDSNRGEHPQDAEPDDEDVTPKPRPSASGQSGEQQSKKKSSRKSPSLAGRGTDTGIVPAGTTLYFDLNFNIAAALCYFPLAGVASILWLVTEQKPNPYLKFHAVQSLAVIIGLVSVNVVCGTIIAVLSVIPVIGPSIGFVVMLVQALVGFVVLGVCFKMAYSVFNGKDGRLPFVASLSDRIVESYF